MRSLEVTSSMPSEHPSSTPSTSSTPICPMEEYSQTSETATVNAKGDILSFPFTDMPPAATNVAVSVFIRGDLAASSRWYYLEGENYLVAYPARFVAKTQCGAFEQEDYQIPQAFFNSVAQDGLFTFEMRPFQSKNIDPAECDPDGNQAYIKLAYMYCRLPSSEPSLTPSSAPSTMPSSSPSYEPSSLPSLAAAIFEAVFRPFGTPTQAPRLIEMCGYVSSSATYYLPAKTSVNN
mgnify:CR=1 FL=1